MADLQIAVPSHGRADVVNTKTLRMLADGGVPAELVRLFVTPDQLGTYRAAVDPGLVAEVLPGALGVGAQHRAITEAYPEGQLLVHVDDDVAGLDRRVDDRTLQPVGDVLAELHRGFAAAAEHSARLWGIYPVRNARFMKPRVRAGLVFILGQLWGVTNTHAPELQGVLDQKDDYERTLLFYEADGAVVRLEDVATRSRIGAPGGMQAPDQPDRSVLNRRSVLHLQQRWPQHVRIAKRRSQYGLEIRLVAA